MTVERRGGDVYTRSARAEARLRLSLARSMLKLQEAGAVDAALAELVRIVLGQDAKGQPIQVPHRTRAQAAASLTRLVVSMASSGRTAPATTAAPSGAPRVPATPEERARAVSGGPQAWLQDVLDGLARMQAPPDPAAAEPRNGMGGEP